MSADDAHVRLGSDTLDVFGHRGVAIPGYDRKALVPRIVHIGVGGFHRAHLAVYCERLAARGVDWGICGVGLLDTDKAMAEALRSQDHLYTLTTRQHETATSEIIGSIIDYVFAANDPALAAERISRPTTAIVSLTITEAGYTDSDQNRRTFDVIADGLYRRRDRGLGGVTLMSCDNMVGNGVAARRCLIDAARRIDGGLAEWVTEECTFPNSMVDRITPATTNADQAYLENTFGLLDRWPVVAEAFQQWVIEDEFAAGRPDFAAVGAVLTDDVHPWEIYKLRLLNAGHSAIAHLAALERVELVDQALAIPDLSGFLRRFLLEESVPTLVPIGGHPPEGYVADVLDRFSNTGIRDQIARVCVDGTAKAATFLMPILEDELDRGGPIQHTVYALAAWAHYLATVPAAEQAADPSADRVRPVALAACDDPAAFINTETGFPSRIVDNARLAATFTKAHRSISQHGPLGAIRDLAGPTHESGHA